MSRNDGFDRMDVSTSIDDDPKFRAIGRRHPDRYAIALAAYLGLLARSWREGERLTLDAGWPSLLPWDQAAADAMVDVGLIDPEMRLPEGVWQAWYGAALERRNLGRDRWRRWNERRKAGTQQTVRRDQQTNRTTDRTTDRPTVPTSGQLLANVGNHHDRHDRPPTNGRDDTCPSCGDLLHPADPNVRAGPGGQLWHVTCPPAAVP